MNGEDRRKDILALLKAASEPISAGRLAERFSVTRQIIVADIALLRAAGQPIAAGRRGYTMEVLNEGIVKRVVVKHGKADVSGEFYAIVDNGGKVLDVIVEHPVYGRISVELNIISRYDVDEFVKKIQQTSANPLSLLTEGLHIHTIAVRDEQAFVRIVESLSAQHILIEST